MSNKKDNYIWCEKYRPDTLDNFVGNDSLKAKIGKMIATGDIPHLLFNGNPGTGKTTLGKIIINNIECDKLYINASDENSIDTVRTKIRSFASTVGFTPLKIIMLDECDYITPNAQAALRNLMETFSNTTRFILTCNYVERLLDPIVSRTQQFNITPPSKLDVAKHLANILRVEDIEYQPADIKLLVDAYYPDIRKVINEAQLHSHNRKLELDPEEIIEGDAKLKIIGILSEKTDSKKRLQDIRQLIVNSEVRDFSQFYDLLFSEVDKYAPDHISQVILHVCEGARWDSGVINKQINFLSVIVNILQTIG